jgi:hypothetical protein
MAQVNFDGVANRRLEMDFAFPFHQKRINETKNKEIINNTLSTLGYGTYEIVCGIIDASSTAIDSTPMKAAIKLEEKDPLLHQIRGVFGSAEVLE